MGNKHTFKAELNRRKVGKVDTPLNDNLLKVKWGEFNVIDVFEVKNSGNILSRDIIQNSGKTPYLCASAANNAVSSYISFDEKDSDKGNCVFIGGKTFVVTYQENDFYSNDSHNLILYLKNEKKRNRGCQLFLAACIDKSLGHKYSWGDSISNGKIQKDKVSLPIKNGKIDFEFMERFVAELEYERFEKIDAYLLDNGLNDFCLTVKEKQVLDNLENGKIDFVAFTYKSIFNKIKQGRRLKKDDQISGGIPFVMAGVTNTGVVNYISNPVASFPKNSITIDIFGNTFYRNYNFGAGDDTGVYWNDKAEYSKESMLFFASSMEKSILGKFNYGKKLRSSKSFDFKMKLPTRDKKPDYETMETIVSAIYKLVIKDVALYVDRKKKELDKIIADAIAERRT